MKSAFAAMAGWLDDRTGIGRLRRHLLDEPLPPGTGWAFTLGSLLLFGLTVQAVTGLVLALYYAPTPDHAWDSVRYITTSVRGGAMLRGLHHWGASLVVVAAVAHLARVVLFGSYRRPREVNWIVGLVLLHVILALGLTGYLLPWDQRAYWATVVTINMSRLAPLVGDVVARLLTGGEDVGALTLTRWYAAHVVLLPALLAGLTGLHLYLLRRHGISGPVVPGPGPSRPFFPDQATRDVVVALAAGLLLAGLAWMGAPPLERPADAASNTYVPRPEWYFLGLFQLLKYFPGRLEVVGAVLIPGLVMAWLLLLPWIDRADSRRASHRRSVLAVFTAGAAAILTLTALGGLDRPVQSNGEWNVQELAGAALIERGDRCVRCHSSDQVADPIEPGVITRTQDWLEAHVRDPIAIAPGVRQPPFTNQAETVAMVAALARLRTGPPPAMDEADELAVMTINRECLTCHRLGGIGGTEGPDLSEVGARLDVDAIVRRLVDPYDVQTDASMPAFGDVLSDDQIRIVAAWLVHGPGSEPHR